MGIHIQKSDQDILKSDFWKKKYIQIDSRQVVEPDQTIFFCIKGKYFDGHDFIPKLYDAGVERFVVSGSKNIDFENFPTATFVVSADPVKLMQEVAAERRKETIGVPVLGITGSNAKTIIKEWIYTLLESDKNSIKSPKSFNSQIGVPLSVWPLSKRFDMAIFEAGISQPGEMEKLQRVIQPTHGLITNIGSAHSEGFISLEQKLDEKLKLFKNSKGIIFNSDNKIISDAINKLTENEKIKYSWGKGQENFLQVLSIRKEKSKSVIALKYNHKTDFSLVIPFQDNFSIENCMHAITAYLVFGGNLNNLQKKVSHLKSLPMRMSSREGIDGCTLIDDSYNNDVAGIEASITFLGQQSYGKKKTVILSSLEQQKEEDYSRVIDLLKSHKVEKFIGVGKDIQKHVFEISKTEHSFYKNTEELIIAIKNSREVFFNEAILVKGARKYGFERIVRLLEKKVHGTKLEINLNAITKNLNYYRSLLKPKVKMMVMLKAFGYGVGSVELAKLLQYHQVNYIGVAYTDEGVELRKSGIHLPIMVLNPEPNFYERLLEYDLEPEVYSLKQLNDLIYFLKRRKEESKFKIHLNIDTGMHRMGFEFGEIKAVVEVLLENKEIVVISVFSHLAAADDNSEKSFTKHQFELLKKASKFIEEKLEYKPLQHILNSSGLAKYNDFQLDMVRLGLGLYGIDSSCTVQNHLELALKLTTTVAQIKSYKKNETIGYGRMGKLNKDSKVATLNIGYADGFLRKLGNGIFKVKINESYYSTIGNICMDMTMVDVGESVDISEENEVIIFESFDDLKKYAVFLETIPYEVLTSISNRVKRIYVSE